MIREFIEYTLRDLDLDSRDPVYQFILKEALQASDILDTKRLEEFIEQLVSEHVKEYDPETYYR